MQYKRDGSAKIVKNTTIILSSELPWLKMYLILMTLNSNQTWKFNNERKLLLDRKKSSIIRSKYLYKYFPEIDKITKNTYIKSNDWSSTCSVCVANPHQTDG